MVALAGCMNAHETIAFARLMPITSKQSECALCVHDNMLYDCMYLLAVMYVSASCLTKATDA